MDTHILVLHDDANQTCFLIGPFASEQEAADAGKLEVSACDPDEGVIGFYVCPLYSPTGKKTVFVQTL